MFTDFLHANQPISRLSFEQEPQQQQHRCGMLLNLFLWFNMHVNQFRMLHSISFENITDKCIASLHEKFSETFAWNIQFQTTSNKMSTSIIWFGAYIRE